MSRTEFRQLLHDMGLHGSDNEINAHINGLTETINMAARHSLAQPHIADMASRRAGPLQPTSPHIVYIINAPTRFTKTSIKQNVHSYHHYSRW